jgi:hypothetical protein
MNTDYVIHMKTKSGRTWSYRKEENGWLVANVIDRNRPPMQWRSTVVASFAAARW